MLELFIFETSQNIEQLETILLSCEKAGCYVQESIHEIFRIMHTLKGSSAMMLMNNISSLAHSVEDLFYFLRERKNCQVDCSRLTDVIFECIDFIKVELRKIRTGDEADGDCSGLIKKMTDFLSAVKQQNPGDEELQKPASTNDKHFYIAPEKPAVTASDKAYKANLRFEDGCEMENIRAFTVIHNLKEIAGEVYHIPEDILDNEGSVHVIREQGFTIYVKTNRTYQEMQDFFMQTIFLKNLELVQLETEDEFLQSNKDIKKAVEESPIKVPRLVNQEAVTQNGKEIRGASGQSIISVNVGKLDKLMDLMGEMVIAEAMVTQNPDLIGMEFDNFYKAARQLHKITNELQDLVMSIRMVPLSNTFHRMERLIRDMSKKLGKEVELLVTGEETEVDKNIIEHISDPLMHLIRNSIDHGIEAIEDRLANGKSEIGTIMIEARNAGSDVLISVKDDGKGLNKEKILQRAKENELLLRGENELTDHEIYRLIFLPGFSTKENVSEFSGRGVGMDVVMKNIQAVGGTVSVDSVGGKGTNVTLKIPLTLAIIDGMNVKVGDSRYTIPTISIRESFRPKETDIIRDPDGNEMIMVRGECHPILRLHEHFQVKTGIMNLSEGILIMIEQDGKSLCVFADQLLGQQQVVVKALPNFIINYWKIGGIAGCTLLGDGSISLILNVGELMSLK